MVKNLPAMQETWVQSLGGEDPLEKGMATHSRILAWIIHGQRNLVCYSPWGRKESGTTELSTRAQHDRWRNRNWRLELRTGDVSCIAPGS